LIDTGFGQQPAQQQRPGGLFGQAPATTLGTTPNPGGGLFGQPAATGGSLFGQQPQQAATMGGMFAQPAQPQQTASLFGQSQQQQQPAAQAGGLFGQNTAFKPATSTFGVGATPAAGFSFGSNLNTQTQQQPSLFSTTTNIGQPAAGSLFGASTMNTLGGNIPSNQQVLHASLNKNPYGNNPLLQKSVGPGATAQHPANLTPAPVEKKLPTLTPSFKVTPRSTSQIKLRGVSAPSNGPSLAESHRNQIGGKKSLHILDGSPRDVIALGLDSRFTPRRSVKRLDIDDASVFLATPGSKAGSGGATPAVGARAFAFDPTLEEAAASLLASETAPSKSSTPKRTPGNTSLRTASPASSPHKSEIYQLSPSLDELLRMSDEDLRNVEGFTVSIPLHGSVIFLEPVDLLSASPTKTRSGIQDIPGEIVIISSQLVIVYPDDEVKPPAGEGLNVPAEIRLGSCWPKDKKTGAIIDNEADPRFDKHMTKLRNMPDTRFLGFEKVTGTWRFRVEHFSRYGLVDDDEDDQVVQSVPDTPQVVKKVVQFDESESEEENDTFMRPRPEKWLLVDEINKEKGELLEDSEKSMEEEEEFSEEDMEEDADESDGSNSVAESDDLMLEKLSNDPVDPIETSMSTIQRIQLAHNVQNMKASLFQSSTPKKGVETRKPVTFSFVTEKRPIDEPDSIVPSLASRTEFNSLSIVPEGSPMKYYRQNDLLVAKVNLRQPVPYERSIIHESKSMIDAALFMGRSFRVGFGPSGMFTSVNSLSKISLKRFEDQEVDKTD
jgi:nuclear pore complex protein Nup98-Nup96